MSCTALMSICLVKLFDPLLGPLLGLVALAVIGDNYSVYVPQCALGERPRVVILRVQARHVDHFDIACLTEF